MGLKTLYNNGPWGSPGNDNRKKTRPAGNGNADFEDMLRKMRGRFSGGGNGNGASGGKNEGGGLFTVVIILGVLLLARDIFYIIDEGHQGIVLRFGKVLTDSEGQPRLVEPGPHFRLPTPIDRVITVRTDEIRKEEIGFASASVRGGNERGRPSESLMLTGDENIIDLKLVIQWKVKDAVNYAFEVRDAFGENTVKIAAESAIREVAGRMRYTEAILGEGRALIESEMKEELQAILDSYNQGILVTSVDLKHIDPPEEVIDAFRDVQTAKANKERVINQSQAYSNDVIPRAKGRAERTLQEAAAYKEEKVAKARGETERFKSVYNEYKGAKDVTRKRIYTESMEAVISQMDKVLVDPSASKNIVPYLPLSEAERAAPKKKN